MLFVSDHEELVSICGRVLVPFEGTIVMDSVRIILYVLGRGDAVRYSDRGLVGTRFRRFKMKHTSATILCIGMLDTKGDEIRLLAEAVRKAGAEARIMELSLGGEVDWADIPLSEVLAEDNIKKELVFSVPRSDAINIVGQAGAKKIEKLRENKEIHGVIAWAGGVGTTTATMVMRALPIGFPKIMLSTLASSDISTWVGTKDIYMVNPIAEKGINRVTRRIVANAAAAITGMAHVEQQASEAGIAAVDEPPLAALTAYGTTTPTVVKCETNLREKGWDTIIIHQVGAGATMEDLIRSGHIGALYDITTAELSNTMFKSYYGIDEGWDGERLTAAGDMGIPQIVCPGGLDQCAYGAIDSVPQWVMDEYDSGTRVSYKNSKKPYIHNTAVTIISLTLEEIRTLSDEMIKKLNATRGPTALIVPMQGWSAYDQSADTASVERGWSKENGDGPVWWPDPDKPKWSRRATEMWKVFQEQADRSNANLDVFACDGHILDEDFAALLNQCMNEMLAGTWKPGLYRDNPIVIADAL